jgi:hypothetical protein
MTEHCLSKILIPKAIKPVVPSSDFPHGTSGKLSLKEYENVQPNFTNNDVISVL